MALELIALEVSLLLALEEDELLLDELLDEPELDDDDEPQALTTRASTDRPATTPLRCRVVAGGTKRTFPPDGDGDLESVARMGVPETIAARLLGELVENVTTQSARGNGSKVSKTQRFARHATFRTLSCTLRVVFCGPKGPPWVGDIDLRIFTEPQLGASHATLVAMAQATREHGFDGFFRSDHVLTMGGAGGLPGPSESLVSLGAIAVQVPDLRLGILVNSATFRHPSMLAIAAATVDDISVGRLEVGLGSGWYEAEHTAYGLPFGASFGERFDRLTEQLEILTGLWETRSTFDYDGRHYQLDGAPGLPKPVQRKDGVPHIPLILGGHGPKRTAAQAARFADEFNVGFVSVEEVGAQIGGCGRPASSSGVTGTRWCTARPRPPCWVPARRCGAGPRRAAAPPTGWPAAPWPGRSNSYWTSSAGTPRSACSASTSSWSIRPTSTRWRNWPP